MCFEGVQTSARLTGIATSGSILLPLGRCILWRKDEGGGGDRRAMGRTTIRKQIIASRLREARKLAGHSQGQVARMLNMHRPTISDIEAGNRSVSAEELARFAEAYDVGMEWLSGHGADKLDHHGDRLQLALGELNKLKPDDLDVLMRVLAAVRGGMTPLGGRITTLSSRRPDIGKRSGSGGDDRLSDGGASRETEPAEWTDEKNARRCDLIDRKIQNTMSPGEAEELDDLQQALRRHLDRVAPLAMDGAKRLHAELVRRRQGK